MNIGGSINLGGGMAPNTGVTLGKPIQTPQASGSMPIPRNQDTQETDLFGIGASRDAVNQAQTNVADWRKIVNAAILNRAMVRKGYPSRERIEKSEALAALGIAVIGQAFGARAQYATGGAMNYLQGVQGMNEQNFQDALAKSEIDYQNETNLRNAELAQAQLGYEGAAGDLAFAQKGLLQKEQTIMDMAENEKKANEARRLAFDKAAWDYEYSQAIKQGDFDRAKELENIRAQNRLLEQQERANASIVEFDKFRNYAISQGYSPEDAWQFAMRMTQPSQVLSPYQQGQLEQGQQQFEYKQNQDAIKAQTQAKTKEYETRLKEVEVDIGVKTQRLKDAKTKAEGILAKAKKNPVYWLEYAQAFEEQNQAEKELKDAKDSYDRLIGEANQGGNQVWTPGQPLPEVPPTISGAIGK